MHITAPVAHGSSGSPILSRRGDVIGVVVGIVETAEGMHFGIRVEALRELVTKVSAPKPFAARVAQDDRLRNLGISAAVFGVIGFAYWFLSRRAERAAQPPARRQSTCWSRDRRCRRVSMREHAPW